MGQKCVAILNKLGTELGWPTELSPVDEGTGRIDGRTIFPAGSPGCNGVTCGNLFYSIS